jgi:O-glycosyl hydrolase
VTAELGRHPLTDPEDDAPPPDPRIEGEVLGIYSDVHEWPDARSTAPRIRFYFQSGTEGGPRIYPGEDDFGPDGGNPVMSLHHRHDRVAGEEAMFYHRPPLGWSSPVLDAHNASSRNLWRAFVPADGAPFDVSRFRFLNVWVRPLDGFEGHLGIELASWDPRLGGDSGEAGEAQGTYEARLFPQRIAGNRWHCLSIPLEDFSRVDFTRFARYEFEFPSGADDRRFLFDELTLSVERPAAAGEADPLLHRITEEGEDPAEATDRLRLTVDDSRRHQTIRGFGFMGPVRDPELLFDRVGATLVRVEIPAFDAPQDAGAERRGFEPTNDDEDDMSFVRSLDGFRTDEVDRLVAWMRAARERGGVRFLACPWSAPGWMKVGGRVSGGAQSEPRANRLRDDMHGEFAEYLAAFALYLHQRGVPLDVLSMANEPHFTHSFPSMLLQGEDMRRVIRETDRRLRMAEQRVEGFRRPRLAADDNVLTEHRFREDFAPFLDGLARDRTARDALSIIAFHGYGEGALLPEEVDASVLARLLSRSRRVLGNDVELWMTETSGHHNGLLDADRPGALRLAEGIHSVLVYGNGSAWFNFSGLGLLYYGHLSWPGIALAHYARFIRPGAVRLEARVSDAPDRVLVVAVRNPAGSGLGHAVVLTNLDGRAHGVDLSGLVGGGYREVRSSRHHALEDRGPVGPGLYVLPPHGIVTLYQGPPLARVEGR